MNSYLKLLLFSVAVALLLYAMKIYWLADSLHHTWPFIVVFYFFQSAVLLFVQKLIAGTRNQNFVLFVIGSISFRMITSLLAAITYLLLFGHQKKNFILLFFALYLLFLGFELFTLMTNLRSNFEKRPS